MDVHFQLPGGQKVYSGLKDADAPNIPFYIGRVRPIRSFHLSIPSHHRLAGNGVNRLGFKEGFQRS